MKILISENQLKHIIEADINFHLSRSEMPINMDKIKPYGSDSIIMMSGRGTGHFGSGMYFSTYGCKNWGSYIEDLQKFKDENYEKLKGAEFQRIKNNTYVVDLDLYKNLYKPRNAQHAEYLFKTLKFLNTIFYKNIVYHTGNFELSNDLSIDYLKSKHNLEKLGLKIPNYKDFIKMIKNAGNNIKNKEVLSSFSTRIMEYNGFNGVNVSGIAEFDNLMHGSVIYDLSKVSDKMERIENFPSYCEYKYGHDIIHSSIDATSDDSELLQGEIPYNINKISLDKQKRFIKKINKFIGRVDLEKFDSTMIDLYYKLLPWKLKKGIIETEPSVDDIEELVDGNRFNIIMDKDNKVNNRTMLEYTLENLWRFYPKTRDKIKSEINRELTPEEQELMDDYNSAYEDNNN